jgi:ABC-type multidrug transport system fused ATPase/permease subunit
VKARDAFRRQRAAVSKVNFYLAERIAGVHVVQLFAREKSSTEDSPGTIKTVRGEPEGDVRICEFQADHRFSVRRYDSDRDRGGRIFSSLDHP